MGRFEFVLIPKEIQEKILEDFFSNSDNTIMGLSKKYGYSYYKINKIIDRKFKKK
jgi:hypothetical protein